MAGGAMVVGEDVIIETGGGHDRVEVVVDPLTGRPVVVDGVPTLEPRHPYDCTENGLREEIGVRKAPGY